MPTGASRPSARSRMLNVVVALATVFGALLVGVPPAPVRAAPVLGGQLFSTGEPVEIEVLAASAGLTSTLFLLEPEEVQIATNRDVGTVVTVGPYGAGEELVFGIRVSGQEYRMGPAVRNPDGIEHATVEFLEDGCAIVGFEDLFGGGDRDYNDNRFQFCGGIAAEPPDPEEPPAPPFVGPNADAGDDQAVDEGTVVTLDGTRSTASNLVTRTYTTTADFAEGTSINLSDVTPDQLQLDDTTEAFEFIWIAASARGTVIKIDTATGEVLGEYWSAPQNRAKDPSRTTVDHNGNVWVGNRAETSGVAGVARGSVTQIGLAENGQCIDRNANGVIDTSSGRGDIKAWPNGSGVDTDGGVETAADECVIHYVRTSGVAIRQVSIDADNHVWVGGAAQGGSPSMFDRLAPDGSIVRTINMRAPAQTGESGVVGCCYGGLVDQDGVLWSSSGQNHLVRIDPSFPNGHADLVRVIGLGRTSYGLGIDPDGFLWQSNWTANTVQKISAAGAIVGTFPTGGPGNDRGVAVTADGDVWVANSGGSSVSRLRSNGSFVTQIGVGSQPTGVAVDADGKVWATNLSSSTASRIDPATNTVDLTVSLGSGAGPYNYSDMTGSTLTGAPDAGTWSVVYDSEAADTSWAFVDWTAELGADASLAVSVASSTDGTTFTPEVTVADATAIEGLADGRYLRVTVRFTRGSDDASPILFDLTVAHEGDRANALAYTWRLIGVDGPPVVLSSTTSATPSFVAPDDASYTFELTVTDSAGQTDTDDVVVRVGNLAPELRVESTQGVAGSLTLVSTSFTDPGWLDTHSGTIDWGDGSITDLHVTDGSGWGTAFGSHRYAEPGSYEVTLLLTDDDGGTSTAATGTVEVAEAIAIWADAQSGSDVLDWPGSGTDVAGRVHSNRDVKLGGSGNTIDGSFEYVTTFSGGSGNTFTPAPVRVSAEPMPISFALDDYRPGGRAAVAAGDQYHDLTATCAASSKFEVSLQGMQVDEGLYYAPCDVVFNASDVVGTFTVVSTHKVEVSGSDESLAQPYIDGLLFFSAYDGTDAMKVAGSNSGYSGFLYAPVGGIEISGSESRFFCGIFAERVKLAGSNNTITGGGCAQPAQDTGGTLLVPTLALTLAADRDEVQPSEQIAYDLHVSNDGASLIVSGLVGAENVDDQAWTVADFAWALETFDVAAGGWTQLATVDPTGSSANVTMAVQPNPALGSTYGTEPFVSTAVDPGAFASWSYEAVVSLDPDGVERLLDPAITDGIRVRFDLDFGDPSARVRQLFRFGNDFIGPLRELSGDITDASVTLILPTGDPILLDAGSLPALASLAPGASVAYDAGSTVAVPAPRGADETDAGYLSRLLNLDGSPLIAASFALASGGVGRLVAPLVTTTTTEHLPVVSISALGPGAFPAGTTADYELKLANLGSAEAPDIEVSATAGDDPLVVSGAPASLEAGQLASAGTSYTAPDENPPADVTVTGEATWSDAAGNDYGPVASSVLSQIQTPATMSATLVDTLQVDVGSDGQVSPGDTVRYTLTVTNHGDLPLENVVTAVTPDANSALVVGSVVAADGSVVSGNGAGEDTVEVAFAMIGGHTAAFATFDVIVDAPFPAGTSRLEVQGSVSADGLQSILTDDPARPGLADTTRTTVVVPVPNLTAFLTGRLHLDPDGNGFPSAGDTLRYELTVNSVGSLPVTGAGVAVPTPAIATLVAGSVTTSQGTVGAGSSVSVDVGSLASFTGATIGFDLRLDEALPSGTNSISAQGTVASAELDDLLTDDPSTFTVGDPTVIGVGSAGSGGGGGVPGVPGPEIGDISLGEGTVLTEPTDLSATLTPPVGETVSEWTVSYRLEGESGRTGIASGTGNDVAATIDPTIMPNGPYIIEIRATGSAGGISVAETSVIVEGNLKLGRFSVTYQDLNVPVGGIPLQVLRTYDSFDKTVGDFGVGWRLELANFRVSTNGPLGAGGWRMFGCGGGLIFVPLCFESASPHYVTVTWPDGRVETFDLTPARGSTFLSGLTSARFTARRGSTSTLAALDSSLYFSNGDLLGGFFGTNGIYDPTRFRLTDRFGTAYILDEERGLLSATDRDGNTVTISSTGVHSSRGPSITFTRDAQGRITRVEGPDDAALTYAYDAAGDLASYTDPAQQTFGFSYDEDHNMLTESDAGGQQHRLITYDEFGRMASLTDAAGNTTGLAFDVDARQEIVTDAAGLLTIVNSYSERGDLIRLDEVADGRTITATYTYDDLGRPTSGTDFAGNESTATWDVDGNLTSLADEEGRTTTYSYGDFGALLTETGPDGVPAVQLEYDNSGHLIRQEMAGGDAYTYVYDAAGQLTRVTDAANRSTEFTYGPAGLVSSVRGPDGRVRSYSRDASGRVVGITDPGGVTTSFEFDDVGNLLSVSDPLDRVRSYTYDAFGRVTSETDPLGAVTSFVYDAAGRLVSREDRNGDLTEYAYDANNRLISEATPEDVIEYGYDGFGRLISLTDGDSRLGFTYDVLGQVLTQVANGPGFVGPAVTLSHEYDRSGLPVSVLGPSGETTYAYDDDGRLASVGAPWGGAFDLTYDLRDRLVAISRPSGVDDVLAWNAAGRLASRVATGPSGVVARADYAYNASGQRTSLTDLAGTHDYGYDDLGRLVDATHPGPSPDEAFAYDDAGNRTSWTGSAASTVQHDAADRLLSDGQFDYTYDAEGRRTLRTERSSGLQTRYEWTTDGLLTAVRHPDGSSTTYRYDPLGRRIETDNAGDVRRFVWDYGNVAFEYNGANALVASYVTAPTVGNPFAVRRDGATSEYLLDGLGSTVGLVDATGALERSISYDAFGAPASELSDEVYAYTGHQWDEATGLYFARARYYDPATGTFLSEDPLPAINYYAYAANDPINLADPSGCQAGGEYGFLQNAKATIRQAVLQEIEGVICEQLITIAVLGLGGGPNGIGAAGEDFVADAFDNPDRHPRFQTPSGQTRIPDMIVEGRFVEVKNTQRLSGTQQILDFEDLSRRQGKGPLVIVTRTSTKLPQTGKLADLVKAGRVNIIKCLPG